MRKVAIVLLVVALGACTTDSEYIDKRCGGITDSDLRQVCGVVVLEQRENRRQQLLRRPLVTCMDLGGGMSSCY